VAPGERGSSGAPPTGWAPWLLARLSFMASVVISRPLALLALEAAVLMLKLVA